MRTAALFLILAALSAAPVSAGTILIKPWQAATIAGETDGSADARILLQFDLSEIPTGLIIESARLRLSEPGGLPWEMPSVPVKAAALTHQWNADDVSWDGPSSGDDWQAPGGDWDPQFTSYRVVVKQARAASSIDLLRLVSEWYGGGLANNGLMLLLPEPGEAADMVPQFAAEDLDPVLTVEWLAPGSDSEGP